MAERAPFIAGNWKMHKTVEETRRLVAELRQRLADLRVGAVDVAVAPPHTALAAAREAIGDDEHVALAAQNMHFEEKGAFTGEVAPRMLTELLVSYVIVGHSERRELFGEEDDLINRKMRAALLHGLVPILCVGESRAQREAGRTEEVVASQVRRGLDSVEPRRPGALVIAYEPLWAIGTGLTATPEQAQEVHGRIRELLGERYGGDLAGGIRIQYGGSVKPHNASELLEQPDIDGALVGGASLQADSFAEIVKAAL